MSYRLKSALVTVSALLILHVMAFAAHHNSQKGDHKMGGHKMGEHKMSGMDHSAHRGDNIHNANVDGYQFAYHLIDIRKQMEKMKNTPAMKDMKTTHHMMVYVKGPDGSQVDQAKVGYLVTGPDNQDQQLMCMSMKGGYGADINFNQKGAYSVKTKVVANGKTLMTEFNYEVK